MENNKLDPKINEPDLSDFDNSLKEIEQDLNQQISEEAKILENLEAELLEAESNETKIETELESELEVNETVDKTTKLDESILTASTPRKDKKNTSNLLKVIAGILLCAILGLLVFLFLGSTPEANNQEVLTSDVDSSQNSQEEIIPETNNEVPETTEEITQEEIIQDNGSEEAVDPDITKGTDESIDTEAKEEIDQQPEPDNASIEKLDINIPDPDKILRAEIPKDDSLIKEEMDLLTDKSERLTEQEQLLDKRVDMMDELTSKKQQQIELLEQQIEQLEKAQTEVETKK